MTQMLEARKGRITEEMEKVALIEGVAVSEAVWM